MLVELLMIEQRYRAVCSTSELAVTDVATRYGVDRRTFMDGLSTMPITAWPPFTRPELRRHVDPAVSLISTPVDTSRTVAYGGPLGIRIATL